MRHLGINLMLCVALCVVAAPCASGADTPGKAILQNNSEFEKVYAESLKQRGYSIAHADFAKGVITPEAMRRFSLIWIDTLPAGGSYYCLFPSQLTFRKNLDTAFKCVEDGAGMVMFFEGASGNAFYEWNRVLNPLGLRIDQSCVRDTKRQFSEWNANGSPSGMCWTENINAAHPATKGVKRVYYPSANLRWDDMYTTAPLYGDANWTSLVSPMADAATGVITQAENKYVWQTAALPVPAPAIAAVRPYGKGFIAVIGVNPVYLHRTGYTKNPGWGEGAPGEVDGIVMEKGDGTVPSDMARLIDQLSEWMAAPAVQAGFGGYRDGEAVAIEPHVPTVEEKAFTPVLDHENGPMPVSWKHCPTAFMIGDKTYYAEFSDPRIPGDIRFFKALVGIRSAFSDGTGTVAEYVAAAKTAGYSVIAFAERFADTTPEKYAALIAECEKNSSAEFRCIPGFEIADSDNNRYMIIGAPILPRTAWLHADGKRIEQVPYLNLGMYNHMVVAHRPNSSPLSIERLKHFQGLSVFTYAGGRVEDNSLSAFQWQVRAGSNPHPIAVHEVRSPAEVAKAAQAGLQQILPSDTVEHAAEYFREGIDHYFEAPARYMISSGPVVSTFVINAKDAALAEENHQQFRIDVGVQSQVPLARVTLMDGYEVVRRWFPAKDATAFRESAFFRHDKQYGLYVMAEDVKGGLAITNSMRTVPERYHFRCSDRQNWLGQVDNYYPGAFLSLMRDNDVVFNARHHAEWGPSSTELPGAMKAVRLDYPFTTPDVLLTENTLDETYVRATWNDVGLDCKPSRLGKSSRLYDGVNRRWNFTGGAQANGLNFARIETDIRMRRPVEAVDANGLFLALFTVTAGDPYCLMRDGKAVTGTVTGDLELDLPAGSVIGGRAIMEGALCLRKLQVGFLPQADARGMVAEGRQFRAAFIIPTEAGHKSRAAGTNPLIKEPERWQAFFNAPSYELSLQTGSVTDGVLPRGIATVDGGASGRVTKAGGEPFLVPLRLEGVNSNWSCGIWHEDEAQVRYTAVREGRAYPRLDVSKPHAFHAGNMIQCDQPGLVLSIIVWEKGRIVVEAHNPSTKDMTARVCTPKAVTTLKALDTVVTVPAGSSMRIRQE